jgi:cyanophycinase
MLRMTRARYWLLCWSFAAAVFAEDGISWIDPAGVSGALLLCGDTEPSAAIAEQFKRLAGDDEAHIVVIKSDGTSASAANVLPGAIVVCGQFDAQDRSRLLDAVTANPDRVGFSLAPGASVAIHGRRVRVLHGKMQIMLAASAGRPLREIELTAGASHDLTMLRRAAIERSLGEFPPQVLPPPVVDHGTLFIHGGGEMPAHVLKRFIDLAGGPDAPIVVLPIAAEGTLPEDTSRDMRALMRGGATNVKSLRARDKSEVESPEFAAALKEARGVWFNGGRQWRFVDAYLGTQAEQLFRDVLRRGGVIGGSSAGASIQSQYMPRGSPLGNIEMMAEGYERGLGFLPGAAVDQHFTQRKRHADMTRLMRRYRQILGIGLDEGTAIVVRGSIAEIIGRGTAHFYNYRPGPPAGEHDFTPTVEGQRYDLVARKLLQ